MAACSSKEYETHRNLFGSERFRLAVANSDFNVRLVVLRDDRVREELRAVEGGKWDASYDSGRELPELRLAIPSDQPEQSCHQSCAR